MHAGEFPKVWVSDVYIERLALVNVGSAVCTHVDQSPLGQLPHRLVEGLQICRDLLDFLGGERVHSSDSDRERVAAVGRVALLFE